MKKWLTSIFLVLALASGLLAGMPLHSENSQMMKCCDKAKMKNTTPEVRAAQLCCLLNCTNSVPTSSNASFNFLPSTIIISDAIIKQIVSLLKKEKVAQTASFSFERGNFSRKFQPKYIQHHSFLI